MLRENAEWALNSLDAARDSLAQRPRLITGTRLPLLDAALRLDVRPQAQVDMFECARSGRGRAERRGTVLQVSTASLGDSELRALIERWYRREAATHFSSRVEHYSERLGVRPDEGDDSRAAFSMGELLGQGTVSLNWRLMMVPSALATTWSSTSCTISGT